MMALSPILYKHEYHPGYGKDNCVDYYLILNPPNDGLPLEEYINDLKEDQEFVESDSVLRVWIDSKILYLTSMDGRYSIWKPIHFCDLEEDGKSLEKEEDYVYAFLDKLSTLISSKPKIYSYKE